MKKRLKFWVILGISLCVLFTTACGVVNEESNLEEGMLYQDFLTAYEDAIYIGKYALISIDNTTNTVVTFDDDFTKVEIVQHFEKKVPTEADFSNVKDGMSVCDVIEIVGMPLGRFTSGMISLDYESSEEMHFRIYFGGGINLKVTGVKKI